MLTMSFATHLECSNCLKAHDLDQPQNLCVDCQKPLFVRYDLDSVAKVFNKSLLKARFHDLWRYWELLPIRSAENRVSLGEVMTPLLKAERLGKLLGLKRLLIKDESRLPTGTFKARGLAIAVSKAKELKINKLAIPSAGNAATALAAYSAKAKIEAHIFMPEAAPEYNKETCRLAGAKLNLVKGLITDAAQKVMAGKSIEGWFDVSTLKEPYRVEGKKTMGFELAEQLNWRLPDSIIYPTGGGTGIIGMWKGFDELETLGFIGSKRPKLIAVQAEGCAPIVKAFHQKKSQAEFWLGAKTIAAGLCVPKTIGDYLILKALYQSQGDAVAVSDAEIIEATKQLASYEGIFSSFEAAATLTGLKRLLELKRLDPEEEVVLFNTGGFF